MCRPRSAQFSLYSHPSCAVGCRPAGEPDGEPLVPAGTTDIAYSGILPPPVSTDDDKLPGWGIAIIVIALVLLFAVLLFAIMMYRAEKRGKPIFVSPTTSRRRTRRRRPKHEKKRPASATIREYSRKSCVWSMMQPWPALGGPATRSRRRPRAWRPRNDLGGGSALGGLQHPGGPALGGPATI